MLEYVTLEVEELQEAMEAFQEEMAQFNARQEAFAVEMARQRLHSSSKDGIWTPGVRRSSNSRRRPIGDIARLHSLWRQLRS